MRSPPISAQKGFNRPAVAVLRVDKRISEEAVIVLYGNNTWRCPVNWKLLKPSIYEKYGHISRQFAVHLDKRDTDDEVSTG